MPKTGEGSPVPRGFCFSGIRSEHFRGELGGPEGYLVEMTVVWGEVAAFIAGLAGALIGRLAERSEERFPRFGSAARERVCVW